MNLKERFFAILNSLIVVAADGYNTVRVSKDPFYYDPTQYGNEGNPRYIIATNAITTEGEANIKKFIEEDLNEDTSDEELQEVLNNNTLTFSRWLGEGGEIPSDLPKKGEQVRVTIGLVPTRNGEQAYRITSMTGLHSAVTRKASFKPVEAKVETPVVKN